MTRLPVIALRPRLPRDARPAAPLVPGPRLRALLPGALLPTLLVTALAATPAAAATGPPAAPPPRPAAVVALGDSAAAGDGAGDYEPGTRGEGGDWCHRSAHAYVHRTGLAPASVNLACSGAESADVGFAAPGHHTEGSQAARLAVVAREHRVTAVLLQVGANDEIDLSGAGRACVRAHLDPVEPPCRTTLGPLLAERAVATAVRVTAALDDVRAAMAQAGYRRADYALVLASYAAPVTGGMVPFATVRGCPYGRADAGWGRTALFPALAAALRGVAERDGARFLDLLRATEGHEACSRPSPREEWQRRLTVDPEVFVHGSPDQAVRHLAQESFHPTAAAHAQIGRCVAEFVRSGAARGACVAGVDGRARVETAPTRPSAAP